ncbi:MAG: hypothetical protein ACE5R4_03725 [Armatimonadota bacterium]
MSPRPGPRRRVSVDEGAPTATQWLNAGAEAVLKVSVVVLLASAAYLIFGILAGHLGAQHSDRVATVFQTTSTIFTVAAILVAASAFVRFYEQPGWVYLAALPGLVAVFVIPFFIQNKYASPGPVGRDLIKNLRLCGEIVFMIVALRAAIAIVDRIRRPPAPVEDKADRAAIHVEKKKAVTKPPLWAKCWQLPYCHDSLLAVCPAYEARRSCWRLNRGCNCDAGMVDRLVEIRAAARGTTAQQQRTARQYVREELEQPKRQTTQQLIPCKKCPIYNEHQRQKFALFNPIVVVVTLIAFVLLASPYRAAFGSALIAVDRFAQKISFVEPSRDHEPDAEEERRYHGPDWRPIEVEPLVTSRPVIDKARLQTWLGSQLNDQIVLWISYLVVCIFAMTYVLRAVEWAILKQKW